MSPPIEGYSVHGNSEPARVVGGTCSTTSSSPADAMRSSWATWPARAIPAALLMCAFQASLRALCELDLPPEETIDRLNRLLCRRFPDNRFVTLFYGVLDPAKHTLTYVNAGHCPPWIVREGGGADRLIPTGGPLGMFEKGDYHAQAVDLQAGELFICYSDGVTEVSNPAGEEFGETSLIELVKTLKDLSPPTSSSR